MATMTRVPAAAVLLLLHRDAVGKDRPELAITAATLRQWRVRGHLSSGRGYDLVEIVRYIDKRYETAEAAA